MNRAIKNHVTAYCRWLFFIFVGLNSIKNSSKYADKIGLEVHAGHGMDYKTTKILSKINEIKEFNIGHFIIGESIFDGLKSVIKKIKKKLK